MNLFAEQVIKSRENILKVNYSKASLQSRRDYVTMYSFSFDHYTAKFVVKEKNVWKHTAHWVNCIRKKNPFDFNCNRIFKCTPRGRKDQNIIVTTFSYRFHASLGSNRCVDNANFLHLAARSIHIRTCLCLCLCLCCTWCCTSKIVCHRIHSL